MSGFDSLNPDFYQTSYSIDDQAQGSYDSNNAGDPYSNKYSLYIHMFIDLINMY